MDSPEVQGERCRGTNHYDIYLLEAPENVFSTYASISLTNAECVRACVRVCVMFVKQWKQLAETKPAGWDGWEGLVRQQNGALGRKATQSEPPRNPRVPQLGCVELEFENWQAPQQHLECWKSDCSSPEALHSLQQWYHYSRYIG